MRYSEFASKGQETLWHFELVHAKDGICIRSNTIHKGYPSRTIAFVSALEYQFVNKINQSSHIKVFPA